MIKTAIEYIQKYLTQKVGETPARCKVYAKTISKDEKMDDGLCITLLRVEQETSVRKQVSFVPDRKDPTKSVYKNPDLDINLYLLISSYSEDYGTQLLQLSEAMRALYDVYDFKEYTDDQLKQLPAKEVVREKLKEMSIELQSLTAEQTNSLWQTLGGTVVPAACYKVRMLTLVDMQEVKSPVVEHVLDAIHHDPQLPKEDNKEIVGNVRHEADKKYHPEKSIN